MAWTQATANGGNSQKTGNRNVNNNASANRQTANYGSSNAASSSSSSGDPRGNEGNNYTNYLTPAPKAPTPIYASPNEQGQNNPAPTPVVPTVAPPKIKLTMGEENDGYGVNRDVYEGSPYKDQFAVNSRNSFTEDAIEEAQQSSRDDWIKEWSKTFQSDSDDQANQIKTLSGQVGDNTNQIDTNRDATGNEIKGVQSQVDTANDDLLKLDAIQKEYGYQLVDVNGNIVDVQNDIIKNKNQQISYQKADLLEQNAQVNRIAQAEKEVGDVYANQFQIQDDVLRNEEGIELSTEQLNNIVFDVDDLGVDLENVTVKADENVEKAKYNQEYWANRLKVLSSQGEDAQTILAQEMNELKDKTYSGDTIVTAEDQDAAWQDLTLILQDFGVYETPAAPKEYLYSELDANLDEWVKSGLVKVERTVEGMLDEYTTSVYTLPDGKIITRKSVSPVITDSDGEEYRFGEDRSTIYIDGVPVGQKDGGRESLIPQGKANHLDSTVMIGEDTNPNSPANRPDGGNQNNTGGQGQSQGNQSETPVAPTDPVVGEDIPLPNDLTDPDGTGAYGQNGQPFSMDGVTYWKRIKDRNGRWTYARLDSYQDNGTASRRAGLSNNVQNF